MKIKDFLEKYGDIEITEEKKKELKKLLDIKENNKWKPEDSETIYSVEADGIITKGEFNENSFYDKYLVFTNNCFRTEEEAKFRVEQIKVYNELKNFADENNDEIDWNNIQQQKYYIYYDWKCKIVNVFHAHEQSKSINVYFSNRELAHYAIEQIGEERIKKYLFEVKDV